MIKKILLKLLVKWYVGSIKDFHKLSPENQLNKYLCKTSSDINEVIRAEITARINKYFEAKSDYERAMIKGEIFGLKMFKENHLFAVRLEENERLKNNESLKLKAWKDRFKK